MATWITGTVVENKRWHDSLFSLRVKTEPFEFTAGQFVRLGLPGPEKRIQRAYSLVNSPGTEILDFMVTTVPEGELSPRLDQLKPGDTVEVSQPPSGFFILSEIPDGRSLWLIGTGTGIGPYFSMLGTEEPWERYENIYLIHGVRSQADLIYPELIHQWQDRYPNRFTYQPVVTREPVVGALQARIPALIRSGELERATGGTLDTDAQIMLCGNPQMITDAKAELSAKGLEINLRRRPGNVTVEQYWK